MRGNRAASRYAKAILSLAREKEVAGEVNKDFKSIRRVIESSVDLRAILKSPVINAKIKKQTLLEVFSGVNPLTKEVLQLLVKNNRVNLLELIASKYIGLFETFNNEQVAIVTTAVALTPEMEQKVRAKVKELTGYQAIIENRIEESIIGGFVLRVGDLQYDASIGNQLGVLKRELQNNTYVSKI